MTRAQKAQMASQQAQHAEWMAYMARTQKERTDRIRNVIIDAEEGMRAIDAEIAASRAGK